MDLTELTNDDLDALRRDVLTEQERRAALATIPAQVAELARVYVDGGGNLETLTAALG
ncbi:hypothetical protein [Georgenia faecalis]|uniref:hypothetical protein n=1 Tax=Georgenia faecalis TaxID=2483799 RepID=UPI0013DE86B8|nr:hypothetical protein [Georgenia faecalis]